MLAAAAGVVAILAIPPARALFALAWPRPVVLIGSMAAAAAALGWFEFLKAVRPAWLAERAVR